MLTRACRQPKLGPLVIESATVVNRNGSALSPRPGPPDPFPLQAWRETSTTDRPVPSDGSPASSNVDRQHKQAERPHVWVDPIHLLVIRRLTRNHSAGGTVSRDLADLPLILVANAIAMRPRESTRRDGQVQAHPNRTKRWEPPSHSPQSRVFTPCQIGVRLLTE